MLTKSTACPVSLDLRAVKAEPANLIVVTNAVLVWVEAPRRDRPREDVAESRSHISGKVRDAALLIDGSGDGQVVRRKHISSESH